MAIDLQTPIDIEQRLLGAMLIETKVAPKVAAEVRSSDFILKDHRDAFDAMCRLAATDTPVTVETVLTEMHAGADWRERLVQLSSYAMTFSWPGLSLYYAGKVKSQGITRYREDAQAHAATLPNAEFTAEMRRIMDEVERRMAPSIDWRNQDERYLELFSTIMGEGEPVELAVPTGIPSLNAALGGLRRSQLTTFAARPGVGKTSLMLNIAWHVAVKLREAVLFFSQEMTWADIVTKLISLETGVPTKRLESRQLTQSERDAVNAAMDHITSAPIVVVSPDVKRGTARHTVESMAEMANEAATEKGPLALVVADYLQICRTTRRYDNRVQELDHITWSLLDIGQQQQCAVLTAAQLNRDGVGRHPGLHNLREADAIGNHSATVMMLTVDDVDENDAVAPVLDVHCLVEKARFGEKRRFTLRYDGPTQRFGSYTRDIDIIGQPRSVA